MTAFENIVIVHGGELAKDVADQILAKQPAGSAIKVTLRSASERPKALADLKSDTLVCFVMQTIENAAPTEDVSSEDG